MNKNFVATLTPEKVFSVKIGDDIFENMRQVSQWEGFIKLKGSKGELILVNNKIINSLDTAFDEINEMHVIKASGDILRALLESDKASDNIPENLLNVPENASLSVYEIWVEGYYYAEGDVRSDPLMLGRVEAETFEAACKKFYISDSKFDCENLITSNGLRLFNSKENAVNFMYSSKG